MADITKLVDQLSELTVLEAADLAKALEEKWGVSAAAAVAAAPAAAGPAAPAAEEKTEFDVILTGDGGKKINVIKEVRAITNLGLGEAKALVEGAPEPIKEGVNKEEAEKIKKQIEEAGGTVELEVRLLLPFNTRRGGSSGSPLCRPAKPRLGSAHAHQSDPCRFPTSRRDAHCGGAEGHVRIYWPRPRPLYSAGPRRNAGIHRVAMFRPSRGRAVRPER